MLTVDIRLVDQRTGWHGERILGLEIVRDRTDQGDEIGNYTVKATTGERFRIEGFKRDRGAEALVMSALAHFDRETPHD